MAFRLIRPAGAGSRRSWTVQRRFLFGGAAHKRVWYSYRAGRTTYACFAHCVLVYSGERGGRNRGGDATHTRSQSGTVAMGPGKFPRPAGPLSCDDSVEPGSSNRLLRARTQGSKGRSHDRSPLRVADAGSLAKSSRESLPSAKSNNVGVKSGTESTEFSEMTCAVFHKNSSALINGSFARHAADWQG